MLRVVKKNNFHFLTWLRNSRCRQLIEIELKFPKDEFNPKFGSLLVFELLHGRNVLSVPDLSSFLAFVLLLSDDEAITGTYKIWKKKTESK